MQGSLEMCRSLTCRRAGPLPSCNRAVGLIRSNRSPGLNPFRDLLSIFLVDSWPTNDLRNRLITPNCSHLAYNFFRRFLGSTYGRNRNSWFGKELFSGFLAQEAK